MRAGIVGVGFMGWIHYLAYQRSEMAQLVAFCSRDEQKRAGDWRSIQGNFGPPGEWIDVDELSVYSSLDEMLTNPEIDLIDICLPPHMHGEAIRKSLAAGKRVLCEKPLALTAEESEALASAGADRLFVAQILPFFPEYQLIVDAVRDGRYGKLVGGRFKRVIGPPNWIADFYDPKTVGGPLIDLHVHDAHLIRMLFGMPTSVTSRARLIQPDYLSQPVPQYVDTQFDFTDRRCVVSAVSGVIDQATRGFTHGFDVQFERANIQFESAAFADGSTAQIPLTIATSDGAVERPEFAAGDAIDVFVAELDAVAEAIAGQAVHPALDARIAADAIAICEMQLTSALAASKSH